ncbi:MAG: GWxTD domain-containing protein [Acidobacteriota bacterium]
MKKIILFILIILVIFLFFISCATAKLEKRLDPQSEDFFSKVRYIISKQESKIFLELPPSEREKFIDDFWERRGPGYKETYYRRIEEANKLFKAGKPGWLTDRGKIYILFGPPDEVVRNPMGGRGFDPYAPPAQNIEGRQQSATLALGEKASEYWIYYTLFTRYRNQIIKLEFVDVDGTGDYRLITNIYEALPGGIDSLADPNIALLHELNKEELEKKGINLLKSLFDFSWEFLKEDNKELNSNLAINIEVPYNQIYFVKEGNRYKSDLNIVTEIKNDADEKIWEFHKDYSFSLTKSEIEEDIGLKWTTKIPVTKWLAKGKYSVYINLKNSTGNQDRKKLLPLKM